MTAQKGLTIAVVALLITLCFGFLANVEEVPSTRTVYNDQVNLEPLLYANSSRGSGVEFYNSIYNVTGWANANVPETSNANQYVLPSNDTYTPNPEIDYDLGDYISTTGGYTSSYPNGGWNTTTTGVYYNPWGAVDDSERLKCTNGDLVAGGVGGTYTLQYLDYRLTSKLVYRIAGVDQTNDIRFYPIEELMTLENRLKVDNDGYYFGSLEAIHETEQTGNNVTDTMGININASQYANCAYFVYNSAIEKWELYDNSNNQVGTAAQVIIVKSGTLTGTIVSYHLNQAIPRYANPNELVPIVNNDTNMAQWSNTIRDATLINARVGALVTGNLDVYPNDTDNAAIQIRNAGGYSITIGATVANIGTYEGLYIILDARTNTLTVYGVLSFSTQAPAIQYELTPFTYTVNYTFDTDRITALYFNGQLTGQAYIANTWVYSDPAGILWNDFSLNLNDYFADRISQHGGVRFSINGVTYYGESLTINGVTFTVTGDKVRYEVIEGIHTVTYEKPINGLNVDFINNSVIVKFSDGTQYNTGTLIDYVVAGAGAWFFSSNLYNIDIINSTTFNWVVGWSLDTNLTCVLYLGLMAVIFMLAAHYGRGEIGGFDYMVMALAGLIAFLIMA